MTYLPIGTLISEHQQRLTLIGPQDPSNSVINHKTKIESRPVLYCTEASHESKLIY